VFFIYKTRSLESTEKQACVSWALVTARTYEYTFVFAKGSYACGKDDTIVFQCKSHTPSRCFATNPDTDVKEAVWKATRYVPLV